MGRGQQESLILALLEGPQLGVSLGCPPPATSRAGGSSGCVRGQGAKRGAKEKASGDGQEPPRSGSTKPG